MPDLDPIKILSDRANSCTLAEDGAWWILVSAVAHLNGHADILVSGDDDQSTAEYFFWSKIEARP